MTDLKTRRLYGPAAGASGGPAPYPARIKAPRFVRFEEAELAALFERLCYPLATHVFGLLVLHTTFTEGEFLGSYARLIELCTPPRPERGRRVAGPTMKQIRNAIDALIAEGIVWRADTNKAQGQLRLRVVARVIKATSVRKEGRN
ncbi:MAG: hypothetical protein J0H69_00585 [Burkholderiales bacterium]|nr:hypothetical protein [Burkholderiales bacterium]